MIYEFWQSNDNACITNEGLCYGCIKNGGPKINHPRNTHAYSGGHNGDLPPGGLPLGGDPISDSEDEEDV